uniref:Uncharacterized protein n=1 Tax=Oxyrrhis marina TaxID=2969 RepID=A0A7S4GQF1_OXYMA
MVAAGALVGARAERDVTPLHLASTAPVAKALIRNGGDVNGRDASGATPLMNACVMGSLEVVEEIIRGGADVTVTNNAGDTSCHLAAGWGAGDIVRSLRRAGDSCSVQNKWGLTPRDLAVESGFAWESWQ